jgi:mannose-6-phosphate isomerase
VTRLTPVFKEKVWGSTKLEPLFPNSDKKIGEVWFEGVDHLPLLIKFLFTSEKLSVQVHPNDDYARLHHGSPGKTEMWHVLHAEPGAKVAAGFSAEITQQELRDSALSGEIEQLLHWHEAAPGDTFFIPAGTVHAIGEGLTLCEIQQQSDITYRLYDYGRPRELHLDRGVEVSHLGPLTKNTPEKQVLVKCPYFTTSKMQLFAETKSIMPLAQPQFAIFIDGSATINGKATAAGDVWFLEENKEEIRVSGTATLLLSHP